MVYGENHRAQQANPTDMFYEIQFPHKSNGIFIHASVLKNEDIVMLENKLALVNEQGVDEIKTLSIIKFSQPFFQLIYLILAQRFISRKCGQEFLQRTTEFLIDKFFRLLTIIFFLAD